jgi:endonuclease/exonuclease/phosphatase family metal-dependent hydrolase
MMISRDSPEQPPQVVGLPFPMATTLRVVQWNIYMSCHIESIANFIMNSIGQGPAIVCLEEVKRSAYDTLRNLPNLTSSCFSLDLREPGGNEGDERKMGIAVFSFGLPIISPELLDRTVFPERTLSVLLHGVFGPIRVVAFHSLTGVGYHKAKSSNFASIADYLQLHKSDLDFLCFDANEPWHDDIDPTKLVFWPRGKTAGLIMGSKKVHDLSDSYVEHLRSTRHIDNARDPLTVSHVTQGTPRRYDYIMHSRRWTVVNCSYPYAESIAASSDHSAVIADYELR